MSGLATELAKRRLIEWFNARDSVFYVAQKLDDIVPRRTYDEHKLVNALKRAMQCSCDHPGALWLKKAFGSGLPNSAEEAKKTLLAACGTDGNPDGFDGCRLSFAAMLIPSDFDHEALMVSASRLGDGFALAIIAENLYHHNTPLAKGMAIQSAETGERDGVFLIAKFSAYAFNAARPGTSNQTISDILEIYRDAADLDHVASCSVYAYNFSQEDPRYYYWRGKAVRCDWLCKNRYGNDSNSTELRDDFIDTVKRRLELISEGRCPAKVVYQIARVFKEQQHEAFASVVFTGFFDRALRIHGQICEHYRAAVMEWLLIADKRIYLCYDVARRIAELVWSCRHEAQYEMRASVRLPKKNKTK